MFGPPVSVTLPSTWPWLAHLVSGLIRRTKRPVRTRFRYAYTLRLKLAQQINSPTHYTKGTLSLHKGALTACRHSISVSISLPLSGFFSPFPHGTCSLSVVEEYLGLDELVHPCSDRISRVPPYSSLIICFYPYGTITLYG